jgi:hypothetical protein
MIDSTRRRIDSEMLESLATSFAMRRNSSVDLVTSFNDMDVEAMLRRAAIIVRPALYVVESKK